MSLARWTAALLLLCPLPAAQLDEPTRKLARDIFQQLIEINTTDSVGSVTTAAQAMAKRLLDAGFPAADVQVLGPAGLEDGPRTINNPEAHVEDYWSRHPGGANMLLADGSVRFLKSSINPISWRALATRHFSEVISSDSY